MNICMSVCSTGDKVIVIQTRVARGSVHSRMVQVVSLVLVGLSAISFPVSISRSVGASATAPDEMRTSSSVKVQTEIHHQRVMHNSHPSSAAGLVDISGQANLSRVGGSLGNVHPSSCYRNSRLGYPYACSLANEATRCIMAS